MIKNIFLNFWITPRHQKSINQLKNVFLTTKHNNFSYTQLSFFFFFRKILITFMLILTFFFFFLLQKDFDICLGTFLPFFFFFFRKISISFKCFFSKSFFVLFIIFIYYFYIYKKNYQKFLYML